MPVTPGRGGRPGRVGRKGRPMPRSGKVMRRGAFAPVV